jgi:hypothetical protein
MGRPPPPPARRWLGNLERELITQLGAAVGELGGEGGNLLLQSRHLPRRLGQVHRSALSDAPELGTQRGGRHAPRGSELHEVVHEGGLLVR